jgi:hypothetical protein
VSGVDRIVERRDDITMQSIYLQYFVSIPVSRFTEATVQVERDSIVIHLNRDEP